MHSEEAPTRHPPNCISPAGRFWGMRQRSRSPRRCRSAPPAPPSAAIYSSVIMIPLPQWCYASHSDVAPVGRSEVMFAHYAVRRNITHAVNITAEGNISCPQGQTSFQNKPPFLRSAFCFAGATRNRTGDKGVADLCLTAWLWRHILLDNISRTRFMLCP